MQHYTYLLLDLGIISIPFLASFRKDYPFYTTWPSFFKAMLITAIFFIVWDIAFTKNGIWGFNPEYLTGIEFFSLPLEEYLFFFVVPYACTFTFYAFRALMKKDPIQLVQRYIGLFLFSLCVALTITHIGRHYTFFTCLFTAIFLGLHLWRWNYRWISWLYISYAAILIPFVLSNGVLTGLWFYEYPLLHSEPGMVKDQIVWYNDAHNLGIRLFSIPLDDIIYGFLLVGLNVTLYQYFLKRKGIAI